MVMLRRCLAPVCLAGLALTAALPNVGATSSPSTAGPEWEAAWRENNLGVALLEQFRFADAAEAFRRALAKDPSLLAARINLSLAYLYLPDLAAAKQAAREALALAPEAPQPNYVLGMIARTEGRPAEAVPYLEKVLSRDPKDLGANVTLGQVYLRLRDFERAVECFRTAAAAEPYNVSAGYNLGVALMRAGRTEEGKAAMQRFQTLRDSAYKSALGSNYLEQGRYAEGLASTGAEAVDARTPEVTFVARELSAAGSDLSAAGEEPLGWGRRLAPAEARSRPPRAAVVLVDLDGDGALDAVVADLPSLRVLRNEQGRFVDVTERAGLTGVPALAAVAGDYDDDGRADLLVLGPGALALFHNEGEGRFADVTGPAQIPAYAFLAATAAFADIDHDGDLDIFVGGLADPAGTPSAVVFPSAFAPASDLLLQNNGNGTFSDVTAAAQLAARAHVLAVVPTDFDNRRDVDLLVLRDDAAVLFKNMRDGSFRDVAEELGLAAPGPLLCAAAGDLSKDGYTDFFLGGAQSSWWALSDGRGAFTVSPAPAAAAGARAAVFLDYDNDGVLDLLAVTDRGPRLLRNLGTAWTDVTGEAFGDSAAELAGSALASGDIDGDGDVDVLLAGEKGLVLLTNQGGNRNRSVAVRLTGRVSSRTGVGAKVEIRAGSLRQKNETSAAVPMAAPADVIFGLGPRQVPDAVRVIWVSGIVQTEIEGMAAETSARRSELAVHELDRKPSSCPYLYAWNGSHVEFVTDFLGAGEMGYSHAPGVHSLPDPVEYVRLAPGQIEPRQGSYELRVTNELEEVLYLDRVRLLAVDHPAEVLVFPDEGMTEPPKPFRLFAARDPRPPKASGARGQDVSGRLAERDRSFADDLPLERIRGYARLHLLTLDLSALPATHTLLLLTGWTDYAFSSDNVAGYQAGLSTLPPRLEAEQSDGSWTTVIEQIGVPVGRPQTVVVDLAGKLGPSRRVRIATTMRVYWDQAVVAESVEIPHLAPVTLDPVRAVLSERGFSAETSPDGREPWSYDYARVSPLSPWKTMPGRYTRLGDVRPLVLATDDVFVIAKPGDELALGFEALPPPQPGATRTFLLVSDGFSKEMDINSASPDIVLPLPYHGMHAYPYAETDAPAHARRAAEQAETWNTRFVARPMIPIEIHVRRQERAVAAKEGPQ